MLSLAVETCIPSAESLSASLVVSDSEDEEFRFLSNLFIWLLPTLSLHKLDVQLLS